MKYQGQSWQGVGTGRKKDSTPGLSCSSNIGNKGARKLYVRVLEHPLLAWLVVSQ